MFVKLYGFSLLIGFVLMFVGIVYLLLFVCVSGWVDYGLVLMLFWVMSVGFVCGVGFVLWYCVWCMLFLGWVCLVVLVLVVFCFVFRVG